jgi:hypothetical protein
MSRISIELTQEQHQKIKAIAALKGSTIREYVLTRILPSEQEEEIALMELEAFLKPRLEQAEAGDVFVTSAADIFKRTLSDQ